MFRKCTYSKPRTSFAGILVSGLVSVFIDGLIGFYFARKDDGEEGKWSQIGLESMETYRKYVKYSPWNFANKLHLIEVSARKANVQGCH